MKGVLVLVSVFVLAFSFLTGCAMLEPEWFGYMQKARNACREGDFNETESYLQKAKSCYGPDKYPGYGPGPGFPIGYSGQLASLADCYTGWQKYDRAESLFNQAIELKPEGGYEEGLGRLYRLQGKSAEAELCFQKMVLLSQKTYKPGNKGTFNFLDLSTSLFDLGDCYYGEGKISQAEVEYEQGLKVLRESSMKTPGFLEYRLMSIGKFYLGQGKFVKAKGLFEEVKSIEEELPKAERHYLDKATLALSEVIAAENDVSFAKKLIDKSLRDFHKDAFKKIQKEDRYIEVIY